MKSITTKHKKCTMRLTVIAHVGTYTCNTSNLIQNICWINPIYHTTMKIIQWYPCVFFLIHIKKGPLFSKYDKSIYEYIYDYETIASYNTIFQIRDYYVSLSEHFTTKKNLSYTHYTHHHITNKIGTFREKT